MFAALGLIELIIFGVFFILLIIATAFDRRQAEEPKWYLLGLGFIGLAVYFWPDFKLMGTSETGQVILLDVVSQWSFWQPAAYYLGFGLLYSALEFGLSIRKAAYRMSEQWEQFKKGTKAVPKFDEAGVAVFKKDEQDRQVPATELITYADFIKNAKSQGGAYRHFQLAVDLVKEFVKNRSNLNRRDLVQETRIVGIEVTEDKLGVEPKVNRFELAEHVGAWTFLWPAYLFSLIIGDLLTEVFRAVADFLASISGRVVKMAFKDVFKV